MDPNAALADIRHIISMVGVNDEAFNCGRLAELVDGLDTWLSAGGFPPDAWRITHPPTVLYSIGEGMMFADFCNGDGCAAYRCACAVDSVTDAFRLATRAERDEFYADLRIDCEQRRAEIERNL